MLTCEYMLFKTTLQSKAEPAIQRYLHDTLGLRVILAPWDAAGMLPYYLADVFAVRRLTIHGHDLLLALDQRPKPPKLSELRAQLERLQTTSDLPVIYVTEAMASYERKRLIEHRVPFLVPGNQLYLPDLGIDLREYFRTAKSEAGGTLSPATQAVLITLLLSKPWKADWVLSEIVARLGYTAMTLTRVLRELAAEGLAEVRQHGRERHLHVNAAPQDLWERARKLMRSPVKRSIWVPTAAADAHALPVAGMSALARETQMADPPWPVYAIGPSEWRQAKLNLPALFSTPTDGCSEWQLWTYSPALIRDSGAVDPLSLTLSLEHDRDDRTQIALDEIRKQFPC